MGDSLARAWPSWRHALERDYTPDGSCPFSGLACRRPLFDDRAVRAVWDLAQDRLQVVDARPHTSPHQTVADVEAALVQLRQSRPHWGPKKLVAHLARTQPALPLPAPSTVGAILKRHGLVADRPHRRKPTHPGRSTLVAAEPNAVWQADFKGEFRLGNGQYCYPLTVSDAYSRFLLACDCRTSTASVGALPVFQRLFAEYGLPAAIRTDNGAPFASPALGGLSRLSVWWIKLGIQHQRIEPGHPEQNGRHERMHRTLKAETTRPPAPDDRRQQARFDAFREEFNTERPHEALEQQTPSTQYRPATRTLPTCLPSPAYAGHLFLRSVAGTLSSRGVATDRLNFRPPRAGKRCSPAEHTSKATCYP
ncbi:MAG: transposase [Armatimonadetes bacterium]|nr:transposase [Armatimonadota bacterium]